LPAELHEAVQFGEETPLSLPQCQRICPSSESSAPTCVIERVEHRQALRAGQPIQRDELFVLCSTHYPGGLDADIVGPLPSGRVAPDAPAFSGAADSGTEYYFRSAFYEALSVGAFRRLARRLTALAAPPELVERARKFARDEALHCRAWLALARGGARGRAWRAVTRRWPPAPRRNVSAPSRYELAVENLSAGCIGESYGAWLALHQARRSSERALRRVALGIARDEAAHAAYAFELHAWLWPQLTAAQQRAATGFALSTIEDLVRPLPVAPHVAVQAGIPAAAAQRQAVAPLQALLVRAVAPLG
jgi:hypothetical protein